LLSALPLLLGLSVLAVIAVGARRSPRSTSSRARRSFGYALVAVPLPLAVALHLFLWPASALDQIAFVVGVLAFGAGAMLVLLGDDENEQPELPDDPDPAPWWPDFEREFRAYARATRVPR
jgi:protein-S-isoprenylcysteine O-methyltransferase Ste14